LFGALIDLGTAKTVLDIGTGTGLLPLMLAQKFPVAQLTALEIDPAATEEANFNFESSPWGTRISAIEGNVIDYQPVNLFDVIICNPPFFPDHLLGPDPKKNAALHTTSLSFKELAFSVNRLSLENASFWCLLPPYQMAQLAEELAAYGWLPIQQFFIHNSLEKPVFRVVSQFTRGNSITQPNTTTIAIRNTQNEYTPEFTALLQPYYLHL
jgi:tRNA1Val (adenine37-N6)-methyltransferase